MVCSRGEFEKLVLRRRTEGKMSNQQFLSKTIVVPSPSGGDGGAGGSASELTRPSSAGAVQPSTLSSPPRRERRSRPASASSGLAEEKKKRKGWAPLRKVRKFFSRGDGMDETRVGEVADHAFNYGNAVKYTPGPESLHSARPRHHVSSYSEPLPVSTRDLPERLSQNHAYTQTGSDVKAKYDNGSYQSRPVLAKTTAETTSNTATEELRNEHQENVYRTTTRLYSQTEEKLKELDSTASTQEEYGDRPVHLTVKLITKLKDRNEDPTVNAREVIISKSGTGYGMSLAGSNPVIVIRIDPNGPADRAGLLVGDMIVAVADIDVRKSTQIHVNRMIMHASKALHQSMSIADAEWSAVQSLQERLDSDQPSSEPLLPKIHSPPSGMSTVPESGIDEGISVQDEPDGGRRDAAGRRMRRVSLDLTSDTELSDSKSGTPDSVKSLTDGDNMNATPGEEGQTSGAMETSVTPATGVPDSKTEGGDGFGVLIRQQSKKMLAKRSSTALLGEVNTLPVSIETEEDERILKMVTNRHSMLLTEAVERCQRDRLDEKEPDACLSDNNADTQETSTGDTPLSGLSSPDLIEDESRSAPNSPSTRRRVKVRRSQSQKGPAVIVKPKSGRVLVSPRPRPTILPGDIAARLVDSDQKSPHVDSGYISMYQDELETADLERALEAANFKRSPQACSPEPQVDEPANAREQSSLPTSGDPKTPHEHSSPVSQPADAASAIAANKSQPVDLGNSHTLRPVKQCASENTATNNSQPGYVASKGGLRRTQSLMVSPQRSVSGKSPGAEESAASPSKTVPAWKLELQKQRKAQDTVLSGQQNVESMQTVQGNGVNQPTNPHKTLKRFNSANVVAVAAAKKESTVVREERTQAQPSETPSWVALAKDKSKRASVHGLPQTDIVTSDGPSTQQHSAVEQKPPARFPQRTQSSSAIGFHSKPANKTTASSRPKSVSSSTLPKLKEDQSNATEESPAKRLSINLGPHDMCIVCHTPVYHKERFSAEGLVFHISCTRCFMCHRKLHLDKFVIVQKHMYCKQHSMEVSMKLAPDISLAAPMPAMSARGGALAMNG